MTDTASPVGEHTVALRLAPEFSLTLQGHTQIVPSTGQRLIACVALADRPTSRPTLVARLWPDLEPGRGAAALRSSLWQVRRKLPGVLSTDSQTVRLSTGVALDYLATIQAARGVEDDERAVVPTAEPFLHDLLVEWQEEWVVVERERYRQIRLHALETLSHRLVRLRRTAAAIEVGLAAVAADPLRETAQRALIEAHLADGNLSEAVREYRSYTTLLLDTLDVAPGRSLTMLVSEALASSRPSARHYTERSAPIRAHSLAAR